MSDLRTPFEQRGHHTPWTTVQEGDDYMDQLLATSPNLRTQIIGQSVNGNPMRLYTVGTGKRKIFFVCQQHGPEVAGREAAFTLLREWAHTTDPDMLAYLRQATILVIPTAHPDNLEIRNNSNGINLNRDHVQLTQPETQAIHAVLRDHSPDIVIDVHEGRNITQNFATGPALNGNVDPALADLSLALEDVVKTSLINEGYTWERYQGAQAMIGAENFHNNAGVQNYLSLLLESRRPQDDTAETYDRHATHIIAIQSIIDWHRRNLSTVRDTVSTARTNTARSTGPIQLMTGTLPYNGPIVDPMPAGYVLTSSELDTIRTNRNRFKITAIRVAEGWFIPTSQMSRTVLAYLLDEQSPQRVVTGMRDFREQIIPYTPPVPPPADLRNIAGFRFNYNGYIMDATLGGTQN